MDHHYFSGARSASSYSSQQQQQQQPNGYYPAGYQPRDHDVVLGAGTSNINALFWTPLIQQYQTDWNMAQSSGYSSESDRQVVLQRVVVTCQSTSSSSWSFLQWDDTYQRYYRLDPSTASSWITQGLLRTMQELIDSTLTSTTGQTNQQQHQSIEEPVQHHHQQATVDDSVYSPFLTTTTTETHQPPQRSSQSKHSSSGLYPSPIRTTAAAAAPKNSSKSLPSSATKKDGTKKRGRGRPHKSDVPVVATVVNTTTATVAHATAATTDSPPPRPPPTDAAAPTPEGGAGKARTPRAMLVDEVRPPPEPLPRGPWPEGWVRREYERQSGTSKGSKDRYWISPAGNRFRSMVQVKFYMDLLEASNGSEDAAWKAFRGRNSSIGGDGENAASPRPKKAKAKRSKKSNVALQQSLSSKFPTKDAVEGEIARLEQFLALPQENQDAALKEQAETHMVVLRQLVEIYARGSTLSEETEKDEESENNKPSAKEMKKLRDEFESRAQLDTEIETLEALVSQTVEESNVEEWEEALEASQRLPILKQLARDWDLMTKQNHEEKTKLSWEENFQKLVEYRQIHGDTKVPSISRNPSADPVEKEVAQFVSWVKNQRHLLSKRFLDHGPDGLDANYLHRIGKLNHLEFDWPSKHREEMWKIPKVAPNTTIATTQGRTSTAPKKKRASKKSEGVVASGAGPYQPSQSVPVVASVTGPNQLPNQLVLAPRGAVQAGALQTNTVQTNAVQTGSAHPVAQQPSQPVMAPFNPVNPGFVGGAFPNGFVPPHLWGQPPPWFAPSQMMAQAYNAYQHMPQFTNAAMASAMASEEDRLQSLSERLENRAQLDAEIARVEDIIDKSLGSKDEQVLKQAELAESNLVLLHKLCKWDKYDPLLSMETKAGKMKLGKWRDYNFDPEQLEELVDRFDTRSELEDEIHRLESLIDEALVTGHDPKLMEEAEEAEALLPQLNSLLDLDKFEEDCKPKAKSKTKSSRKRQSAARTKKVVYDSDPGQHGDDSYDEASQPEEEDPATDSDDSEFERKSPSRQSKRNAKKRFRHYHV